MYVCMHVCTDILHKSGTNKYLTHQGSRMGFTSAKVGNLFQKKYIKKLNWTHNICLFV